MLTKFNRKYIDQRLMQILSGITKEEIFEDDNSEKEEHLISIQTKSEYTAIMETLEVMEIILKKVQEVNSVIVVINVLIIIMTTLVKIMQIKGAFVVTRLGI